MELGGASVLDLSPVLAGLRLDYFDLFSCFFISFYTLFFQAQ